MSVWGQKNKSSQSFLEMLGWMSLLAGAHKELPKKVDVIPNNTKGRSVVPSLNSCSGIAGLKRGLKQKKIIIFREITGW